MSGITIQIDAGSTPETSSVRATGSIQHITTDEERATFGILDGDLKRKIGETCPIFQGEPREAYLRSPDYVHMYESNGWAPVETVLTPIETTILSVATVPTIVDTAYFENQSDTKVTHSRKLTEQKSTTVTSSWSESHTLSINQEIKYELGFMGVGGGGSTSFGFQKQWGTSFSESHATTIGEESGVSVPLEPGQRKVTELRANSGKMLVRITYEARLIGVVGAITNIGPCYPVPISNLLGASNSVKITEDIEIGFYGNVHIITKNAAG